MSSVDEKIDEMIDTTAAMRLQLETSLTAVQCVTAEYTKMQFKLAALQRSLQQIATLDPNDFNAANKAVAMAKSALIVITPK